MLRDLLASYLPMILSYRNKQTRHPIRSLANGTCIQLYSTRKKQKVRICWQNSIQNVQDLSLLKNSKLGMDQNIQATLQWCSLSLTQIWATCFVLLLFISWSLPDALQDRHCLHHQVYHCICLLLTGYLLFFPFFNRVSTQPWWPDSSHTVFCGGHHTMLAVNQACHRIYY